MAEKASEHVLVTGGAGYIGSHTAKAMALRGFIPVTYDDLSNGHRWAVQWGPFEQGDIGDQTKLAETIRRYEVSAIVHFAAFAYVGESMVQPERYFENNVSKSSLFSRLLLRLAFAMLCSLRVVLHTERRSGCRSPKIRYNIQ